ncbi:coiled-coil-helix-coiled-coil-helix domain containing 3a isoform X4 [Gadus morhua]|uniref:coiled-coil-helix-coiled-coil-helix domain containing 3a isoform X4 n=1 Tax=Gadus morhua TaxID=8049 RepID=UPI0011B49D12|nr:MICOS complex subunit Mic19-like isoform X4 [Gadus morhua]
MGANNSTRRVSFESDDNENITVVKGIRLSENVINRMRDGGSSPLPQMKPPAAVTPPPHSTTYGPPPLLRPIPPPFDPVTSMPAPPRVAAVAPPASEEKLKPLPPTPPPIEQPQVLPLPPAPAPEPAAPPQLRETTAAPPSVGTPPVDEEALRKRIREELHNGLEQERAKAEQELQAWLEAEKDAAAALAQADAQARVQQEVSRVLTEERALSRDGLHAAVLRERASADDEKLRAQRYEVYCKAKHLEVREAELRKQDLFYRQQVARLEERSAQFYKVTTENYHKAADHVNGKFRRYETHPVCAELQGEILKCYQENAGKTLQCSGIAARYLECVDGSKQNKSRNGG